MLDTGPDVSGTIECVVERRESEPTVRRYVLTAGEGHVEISEHEPDGSGDATVTGSEEEWVRALGPEGELGGLDVSGDRGLAEGVLRGIVAAATRRAAA
jgi:hypothetical protein